MNRSSRGLSICTLLAAFAACGAPGTDGAPSADGPAPSASPTTATASPPGGSRPEAPGARTPARTPGSSPAGEVFWTAFNAGRYEDLGSVQSSLEKAITAAPSDGYVQRLLGASSFWQVAESGRAGGGAMGDAFGALKGIRTLQAAKAKAPDDPWLPCFLGILQYEVGARIGSAAQKADGLDELARGIAMYPEFNTYCRALARGGEPRGSAEFQAAIDDFWKVVELCDPTVTKEHPEVTDPSKMAGCTQRARVPHGYNGIWMTLGDVMLKAGDARVARAFYENAKGTAYETWSEKQTLENRISAISTNQARWTDADPKNDPELTFLSPHACVMCHAK